jgi:hypothetical protein
MIPAFVIMIVIIVALFNAVRPDIRHNTDDGFGTHVLFDALPHQISWRDLMHGRVAERRMSLAV